MSTIEGKIYTGKLYSDIVYMIEADEELGEFFETEDGVMVNLFWSNDSGWQPFFIADYFTEEDYFNLNLPQGGHWVQVQKNMSVAVSNSVYVMNEVSGITREFQVFPSNDTDNTFRVV